MSAAKKRPKAKVKRKKTPARKPAIRRKSKPLRKRAAARRPAVRRAAPRKRPAARPAPRPRPATPPAIARGPMAGEDTIRILGHTSDIRQRVDSMQIEHQPVSEAAAGQEIGLRVTEHTREGDVVYKVAA